MKEILLFTIPHTGTHTMQYLFNHLMGIKVWWGHFEKQNDKFLDQILDRHMDPERFVHVQTWRSYQSMEASYSSPKRGDADKTEESMKYFDSCLDTKSEYQWRLARKLGYPIRLDIEAPAELKALQARKIFRALDIKPSAEALEFMLWWPRINAHELHNDDRKDKAHPGIKSSHVKQLLQQLHKEENDHGT